MLRGKSGKVLLGEEREVGFNQRRAEAQHGPRQDPYLEEGEGEAAVRL